MFFSRFLGFPARPPLLPAAMAEFALQGDQSLRDALANARHSQWAGRADKPMRFGNAVAKRHEIEAWLEWRAAKGRWWFRAATVAAGAAAVLCVMILPP